MSPESEEKPYVLEKFADGLDSDGFMATSNIESVIGEGTQRYGLDFASGSRDIAEEVKVSTSHEEFKDSLNETTSKILSRDVIEECFDKDFLLGLKGSRLYVLAKREYTPKYVSLHTERGRHEDYALSDIDDYIEDNTSTTEPHPDYYDVSPYDLHDNYIPMNKINEVESAYEIPIYKLTERLREECYIAIPLSGTSLVYKYQTNGHMFKEYHTNHSGKLCLNSFTMGVDDFTTNYFDSDEIDRVFSLINSRSEVINTGSVYSNKPRDDWPHYLWIKKFIRRNRSDLPETDIRSW